MIRTSLVVAALLGWTSVAAAQSAAEPPAPAETAPAEGAPVEPPTPAMMNTLPQPTVDAVKPGKQISVTRAPLLLVVPLIELTAEYRVSRCST